MGNLDVFKIDTVLGNYRVCMVECDDDTVSEHDVMTNARLIAAAPDLLWTLEQVDAYLSPMDGEEDIYAEIRGVIHAAINKSRGNPE